MRKKSKPTGLIIALTTFVVAAAGINAFQQGLIKMPAPGETAAGESRQTESSTKDVANSAKGNIAEITKSASPTDAGVPNPSKPATGGKMSEMAAMMLKNNGGKPLMAIAKPGSAPVNKPKPNDASIAGQWYSTESRQ